MATMDIFEGDAFSIIELTRALENIPFKPAILSGAALFGSRGVRTRTVMIESRDGTLQLIPFSERGSAYESQIPERRDMRAFVCRQFKKQDVLWASEIQAIRDFGSETAVQQVQTEIARKLGRLRNDAEATFEFHLFNGIQGVVKDPRDGATVINYYTEFNITPVAEVDFDLDNATPGSGVLRKRCQALIESVEDTLGGLAAGAVQLRAECGSAFFADLVAHKEVRETYLNTAAAADLRGRVGEEVSFGGITFRRYRGGLGFGVPTDKAYFYPEGVEGLFEIYYAPADTFETVNTVGLPLYARMIPDRDRDEWVKSGSNPAVISTAGRGRVNIHGAVNLETFDAPFVEPTTVDGVSAVQLLTKIEARNPDKRIIHVIWDNAAYHKGPDVRAFLARTACRIQLIQLPPYCPHLNPIERLWAVLHQYVTHNRYYPNQKQFADAVLAFMRETIPHEWTKFRDKVSDNFRVITHENFRILE